MTDKDTNLKVYNPGIDELIPATQEWIDGAQKCMNRLADKIELIKSITDLNVVKDGDFIFDLKVSIGKYKSK